MSEVAVMGALGPEVDDERTARLALSCVLDGGDPKIAQDVQISGASKVWSRVWAGEQGLQAAQRAKTLDLSATLDAAATARARFVVPGDEEWPAGVGDLELSSPVNRMGGVPLGLWLRGPGHLAQWCARSVAIVGSRAATAYGTGVAADLGADLAERGVTVVSGGAFGIDAATHRGAMAVGGPTIAVLANGVDVAYPQGNAGLLGRMAHEQLVVSELPPGAHPSRVRFLARNRLIAALSQGTVVVEAAVRSGARNTVSWATECQRPVMAVPGPVHSALSVAPHLMVRTGQAVLVTRAVEVLELISGIGEVTTPDLTGETRVTDGFSAQRLAVFEAVPGRGGSGAGEIAMQADVSVPIALAELQQLELMGLLENGVEGWRVIKPRQPRLL